jgi:hypothetical protein
MQPLSGRQKVCSLCLETGGFHLHALQETFWHLWKSSLDVHERSFAPFMRRVEGLSWEIYLRNFSPRGNIPSSQTNLKNVRIRLMSRTRRSLLRPHSSDCEPQARGSVCSCLTKHQHLELLFHDVAGTTKGAVFRQQQPDSFHLVHRTQKPITFMARNKSPEYFEICTCFEKWF